MTATTKARGRARLEARIDAELGDLISEAVDRLDVTKTAFVSEALRETALKVIARSDIFQLYDGLDRYRRRVIRIAHVGFTAAPHHQVINPVYHVVSLLRISTLGRSTAARPDTTIGSPATPQRLSRLESARSTS